jgi:hypothetical protein
VIGTVAASDSPMTTAEVLAQRLLDVDRES